MVSTENTETSWDSSLIDDDKVVDGNEIVSADVTAPPTAVAIKHEDKNSEDTIKDPTELLFSTTSSKRIAEVSKELFINLFQEDREIVINALRVLQNTLTTDSKKKKDSEPSSQEQRNDDDDNEEEIRAVRLILESGPPILLSILCKRYNDPKILVECYTTVRFLFQFKLEPTISTKPVASIPVSNPFGSSNSTTGFGAPSSTGFAFGSTATSCSFTASTSTSGMNTSKNPTKGNTVTLAIHDNLITIMMQWVVLTMSNFRKHRDLQTVGLHTLTAVLEYVVDGTSVVQPCTELSKYLQQHIEDGTTNSKSISMIKYVITAAKNFPDDIELNKYASQFFQRIICKSSALNLPTSYAPRLVKLGVLAMLSHVLEVCDVEVHQNYILPALSKLSSDYQTYLVQNPSVPSENKTSNATLTH